MLDILMVWTRQARNYSDQRRGYKSELEQYSTTFCESIDRANVVNKAHKRQRGKLVGEWANKQHGLEFGSRSMKTKMYAVTYGQSVPVRCRSDCDLIRGSHNSGERTKMKTTSHASMHSIIQHPSSRMSEQPKPITPPPTREKRKRRQETPSHSNTNAAFTLSLSAINAASSSTRRHSLNSVLRSATPCSTSKMTSRMRTGKRSPTSSSFTPSAALLRTPMVEPYLRIIV
jgi:hypothetical protein